MVFSVRQVLLIFLYIVLRFDPYSIRIFPVNVLVSSFSCPLMSNIFVGICYITPQLVYVAFLLTVGDWLRLMPFVGTVGGIGFLTYRQMRPVKTVNQSVAKSSAKVVDTVDIEDITGEKACYCRCWRSKKVYVGYSTSSL